MLLEFSMCAKVLTAIGLTGAITSLLGDSKTSNNKLATSKFKDSSELKNLTGDDGFILSKSIQLNKQASREHVLIVGATGSGKTTSLFYNNLLSNYIEGSIIITDPKGELYRDTANYQKSIGRTPILFSPLNSLNAKYNLLKECKSTTEIRELAQTILLNATKSLELQTGNKMSGIEWINMSLPLFISALLYCKCKGENMCSITNAARLIINNSTDNLKLLLGKSEFEEVREQFKIFESCLESPKTASSIKITLNSSLQLFLDENIIQTTNDTTFNAELLRKKKIALYISYSEHKSNYLSPFMATFFTQLINRLMDLKGEPVNFLLDEFANIGVINGLTNIISTCRSRQLSFLICLQSTSQLIQVYGNNNAKAILNNLKSKCILPSTSDTDTLNYISDLLGETEIEVKNTNKGKHSTTESISKTRRKLLTSDEIRRLETGKILIICHNRQPILDTQDIYYVNKKYINRIV